MNSKKIALAITLAVVLKSNFLTSTTHAQTLIYSDNFDSGASDAANWNINSGLGNNAATFGYDYSTLGIPAAPNSGGTTIGVKLEANYATATGLNANGTGISISPSGRSFSGDYMVTFYLWQNFVGPGVASGSGTTQLTGAGIGTSGTVTQHSGIATSSLWFAQTGDGGNSTTAKDYRIYSSAASAPGTGYATNSGVYAAGISTTAADNLNAHYAALGGNTEPAGEGGAQTGTTAAGAPAFAWHQVTIMVTNGFAAYSIDSTLIATVDLSTVTLNGGDIELIQSDINAGASTDPNVRKYEFGLFEGVQVYQLPEPTTYALAILGAAGLFLARRRQKSQ